MYVPFFRAPVFSCLLVATLSAALGLSGCSSKKGASPSQRALRVAAASDLETAFTELGQLYGARFSGRQVVFSFASSSVLAQQVEQGAPFDLYAAANATLVEKLEVKGRIVHGSRRPYARGRLVLYSGKGSAPPASIEALREPRFTRIAIANPEHAPYGQAAVQALRAASLYDELKSRLVFSENIRQAHQYVETGNTDVALGARSLLKDAAQRYTEVPQSLYAPLVQVLGVVAGGDETAAAQLAALILSPEGQALLARHGFLPPN